MKKKEIITAVIGIVIMLTATIYVIHHINTSIIEMITSNDYLKIFEKDFKKIFTILSITYVLAGVTLGSFIPYFFKLKF